MLPRQKLFQCWWSPPLAQPALHPLQSIQFWAFQTRRVLAGRGGWEVCWCSIIVIIHRKFKLPPLVLGGVGCIEPVFSSLISRTYRGIMIVVWRTLRWIAAEALPFHLNCDFIGSNEVIQNANFLSVVKLGFVGRFKKIDWWKFLF